MPRGPSGLVTSRPVDSEIRLPQLGHLRGVTPRVFGRHRTDSSNPIWVAGCPERPFGQNDCAAFRWPDVKDQLLQYRSGVSHVCRATLRAHPIALPALAAT